MSKEKNILVQRTMDEDFLINQTNTIHAQWTRHVNGLPVDLLDKMFHCNNYSSIVKKPVKI